MRKLLLIGCAFGALSFSGCSLDALMGRSDDLYAQSKELSGSIGQLNQDQANLRADLADWQNKDAAEKGAIIERIEKTGEHVADTIVAVQDISEKAPSKVEAGIAIVGGVVMALWGNTAVGRMFRVFMAGRAVSRETDNA